MSTPSYIANNVDELFEQASVDIQSIIESGEVETTVAAAFVAVAAELTTSRIIA